MITESHSYWLMHDDFIVENIGKWAIFSKIGKVIEVSVCVVDDFGSLVKVD